MYSRISLGLYDLPLCFLLNDIVDDNIEILELLHDVEAWPFFGVGLLLPLLLFSIFYLI